jgi:hypothetical protein
MNDEAEHHFINTDDKPVQKISHFNNTYKTIDGVMLKVSW